MPRKDNRGGEAKAQPKRQLDPEESTKPEPVWRQFEYTINGVKTWQRYKSIRKWKLLPGGEVEITVKLKRKWILRMDKFSPTLIDHEAYEKFWYNPNWNLDVQLGAAIALYTGTDPFTYRDVQAREWAEDEAAKAAALKKGDAAGEDENGDGNPAGIQDKDSDDHADIPDDGMDIGGVNEDSLEDSAEEERKKKEEEEKKRKEEERMEEERKEKERKDKEKEEEKKEKEKEKQKKEAEEKKKPAEPEPESDEESEESEEEDEADLQERDVFIAQLYKFHEERNTPINTAPAWGGKDLDLHKLYRYVTRYGGAKKCTDSSLWKKIMIKLGLENTGAQPVNVKKAYIRYLEEFHSTYSQLGWSLDDLLTKLNSGDRSAKKVIDTEFHKQRRDRKDKGEKKAGDKGEAADKKEGDIDEEMDVDPPSDQDKDSDDHVDNPDDGMDIGGGDDAMSTVSSSLLYSASPALHESAAATATPVSSSSSAFATWAHSDDIEDGLIPANLLTHFWQGMTVHALHSGQWTVARIVKVHQPSIKTVTDAIERAAGSRKCVPGDAFGFQSMDELREISKKIRCLVHYLGWNSSLDEYMHLPQIRISPKDDEASMKAARPLLPEELLSWVAKWSRTREGMEALVGPLSDATNDALITTPSGPPRISPSPPGRMPVPANPFHLLPVAFRAPPRISPSPPGRMPVPANPLKRPMGAFGGPPIFRLQAPVGVVPVETPFVNNAAAAQSGVPAAQPKDNSVAVVPARAPVASTRQEDAGSPPAVPAVQGPALILHDDVHPEDPSHLIANQGDVVRSDVRVSRLIESRDQWVPIWGVRDVIVHGSGIPEVGDQIANGEESDADDAMDASIPPSIQSPDGEGHPDVVRAREDGAPESRLIQMRPLTGDDEKEEAVLDPLDIQNLDGVDNVMMDPMDEKEDAANPTPPMQILNGGAVDPAIATGVQPVLDNGENQEGAAEIPVAIQPEEVIAAAGNPADQPAADESRGSADQAVALAVAAIPAPGTIGGQVQPRKRILDGGALAPASAIGDGSIQPKRVRFQLDDKASRRRRRRLAAQKLEGGALAPVNGDGSMQPVLGVGEDGIGEAETPQPTQPDGEIAAGGNPADQLAADGSSGSADQGSTVVIDCALLRQMIQDAEDSMDISSGSAYQAVPPAVAAVPAPGVGGIRGQVQPRQLTYRETKNAEFTAWFNTIRLDYRLHEHVSLRDLFQDFSSGTLQVLLQVLGKDALEPIGPQAGKLVAAHLIQFLNKNKGEDQVVDVWLNTLVRSKGLAHECSAVNRFWCRSLQDWYEHSREYEGDQWDQLRTEMDKRIGVHPSRKIFIPLIYQDGHISLAVIYTERRLIEIVESSRRTRYAPDLYGKRLCKFFMGYLPDTNGPQWTFEDRQDSHQLDPGSSDVRISVVLAAWSIFMDKPLTYPPWATEYMRLRAVIQIVNDDAMAH